MDDKFLVALERAIEGKGFTPKSFSVKVGVSGNAVLKWIKEDSFPRADKWQVIKQHSGVDPQKYVNYTTGEKGVMAPIQTTNGNSSPAQQHTGAGNVAMFDRDSITCTGYDESHPPEGVDVDDFAELLFWIKRRPAMVRTLIETARAYRDQL